MRGKMLLDPWKEIYNAWEGISYGLNIPGIILNYKNICRNGDELVA